MKYNDNGTYKDIYIKSFDTLPVGTEVDYDGQTVPSGWTEVDEVSEWIDISTSKFTAYYRTMGRFVEIKVENKPNVELRGYIPEEITTLPVSLRPSKRVRLCPYQQGKNVIYFQVSTEGVVAIFNWGNTFTTSENAGTVAINALYIAG